MAKPISSEHLKSLKYRCLLFRVPFEITAVKPFHILYTFTPGAYPETSGTSTTELYPKIVNG